MEDRRVSGNIWAKEDRFEEDGFTYIIKTPITNQGWGLPTRNLEPDDLRKLADEIEKIRIKP